VSGATIHRPRHTRPAKSENLVSPVHRNPQGTVAAVHNPALARARAKVSAAAADRGYDLITASEAACRTSAKERQLPPQAEEVKCSVTARAAECLDAGVNPLSRHREAPRARQGLSSLQKSVPAPAGLGEAPSLRRLLCTRPVGAPFQVRACTTPERRTLRHAAGHILPVWPPAQTLQVVSWCANATAESPVRVKRLRTGGPCRISVKSRQPQPARGYDGWAAKTPQSVDMARVTSSFQMTETACY